MATQILPILPNPGDNQPQFEAEKHAYTHAGCGSFAIGLHRITGWKLVVFDMKADDYAHLGVRAPDGTLWDASGPHESIASFVKPFTRSPPDTLRDISLATLIERFPLLESSGIIAERHASMMYPGLPHLPTSDRSRNVRFMDAVERLSKKRNVWILAHRNALNIWPVIGEAFEGIAGYRACTNGGTTFDRALHSEMPRGPNHLDLSIARFLKGLTELSEEHGLWIRAGTPMTWPRLRVLSQGSQRNRYVIRQTDNGGGFLVNLDLDD